MKVKMCKMVRLGDVKAKENIWLESDYGLFLLSLIFTNADVIKLGIILNKRTYYVYP